jgi:hypothetical protein
VMALRVEKTPLIRSQREVRGRTWCAHP